MKFRSFFKITLACCALLLSFAPDALLACTACYGKSDSPLAEGMNWGILTLLGFILFVLASISAFFIYIAKRSATQKI